MEGFVLKVGPDYFDESYAYPNGFLPNPVNPVVAAANRPGGTVFPRPGEAMTVEDVPAASPANVADVPGQEAEFRVNPPTAGLVSNVQLEAYDPADPRAYQGGPFSSILNRTGATAVGPLAALTAGGGVLMLLNQVMRGRKRTQRGPKPRPTNPVKAVERVVAEVGETTEDAIEKAADIVTGRA